MKSERSYPIYKVNKKAEASLVGGHPWVYENDILEFPETEPENGTLADVVSPKGAYLGTGFVSLKSKIRVRLISRNANDTFDAGFWRRRVEYAWTYRKTVLEPADLSACRVIFGEADLFPGLTVDRFGRYLVAQTLSVGIERIKPMLFPLLVKLLRDDGQQIDGPVDSINSLRNAADKWRAFGWNVQEIDGHDYQQIYDAIEKAKQCTDRPNMLVMRTVKGKGWKRIEGTTASHSRPVTAEDLQEALRDLQ